MANQDMSGRRAARRRREAQVHGKKALVSSIVEAAPEASGKNPVSRNAARASTTLGTNGRDASLARRKVVSRHGKSALASKDRQRTASDMRNTSDTLQQKECGCGCNGSGACGRLAMEKTAKPGVSLNTSPVARRSKEAGIVTPSSAGRLNSKMRRQAMSLHGKNGADICRKGLTSAQLVRQQNPGISGRELARSVRAQRATRGAVGGVRPQSVGRKRPARTANVISGTRVSHSEKTTGDETGLCRTVTGTEYLASEVFDEFCHGDGIKAPGKVETTETLRGARVTSGGKVGRSGKVTGDERGSCRMVTGDEYVGREQYDDFCEARPEPGGAKVSFSQTTRGQVVSGSKPARSRRVTGDEAGTCKAVTGTPYAGVEQYQAYCEPDETQQAVARAQRREGNAGRDITGIQPSPDGLTGANKGACLNVSGTAYVGAAAQSEVCGAQPARIGEADFPQPLTGAPWGAFSVVSPSREVLDGGEISSTSGVTGSRYEQGRISGTFSLGEGKVTGTDEARFGKAEDIPMKPVEPATVELPRASRVTGEGIETTQKVTGDDWGRGERVTGTEGASAVRRNPTRRGPVSAMPAVEFKRNEGVSPGEVNVTGGAGGTERGALVTLSGGARG